MPKGNQYQTKSPLESTDFLEGHDLNGNKRKFAPDEITSYIENSSVFLAGTSYKGEAQPDTEPATTGSARVLYTAYVAGTYTNFEDVGGLPIVVYEGEAIFLYWNGSYWAKHYIYKNIDGSYTGDTDQSKYQGVVTTATDPTESGLDIEDTGNWVITDEIGTFTNFIDVFGDPIELTDGKTYLFTYASSDYWVKQQLPITLVDTSLFLGIIKPTDPAPVSPSTGAWGIAQGAGVYSDYDGNIITNGVETYLIFDGSNWVKYEFQYTEPDLIGIASPSTTPKSNPKWGQYYLVGSDGDYINFFGVTRNLYSNNNLDRIYWNGNSWVARSVPLEVDNKIRPRLQSTASARAVQIEDNMESGREMVLSQDWDLTGQDIDFSSAADMTLNIEGKVIGATITGNNTFIPKKTFQIFDNCTFSGTFRSDSDGKIYTNLQGLSAAQIKSQIEAFSSGGNKHLVISDNVNGGGLTWTLPPGTIIDVTKGGLLDNYVIDGSYELLEKTHQVVTPNGTFSGTPKCAQVNTRMFGAVGDWDLATDSGTDDTASIQAMYTFATLANGSQKTKVVFESNKVYGITDTLYGHSMNIDRNGSIIKAQDNTVKIAELYSPYIDRDSTYLLGNGQGGVFVGDYPLRRNAVQNENGVLVNSIIDGSETLEEGDMVLLTSKQNWTDGAYETNYRRGELKVIYKIREFTDALSQTYYSVTFVDEIKETGGYRIDDGGILYGATLKKLNSPSIELRNFSLAGEGDRIDKAKKGIISDNKYGNGIVFSSLKDVILDNYTIKDFNSIGTMFQYCYRTHLSRQTYDNGGIGNHSNGGYGIVLYGANSYFYLDTQPEAYGVRHIMDASSGSGFLGRTWDFHSTTIENSGNNKFTGQGMVAPHPGMGSFYVDKIILNGIPIGKTLGNYAIGDIKLEDDEPNNINNYYQSITGTNNTPSDNPSDWAIAHTPNLWAISGWDDTDGTAYSVSQVVEYQGKYREVIVAHTHYTATPIYPDNDEYYRDFARAKNGGLAMRGPVRRVEIGSLIVKNAKIGFIGYGIDNLHIGRYHVEDSGGAISSSMGTNVHFGEIYCKNTPFVANNAEVTGEHEVFEVEKLTLDNSRWGAYTVTYLPSGLQKIRIKDVVFKNQQRSIAYRYGDQQGAGFVYSEDNGTNKFEGFEFDRAFSDNGRFNFPYMWEYNSSGRNRPYSLSVKNWSTKLDKENEVIFGIVCGNINMNELLISGSDVDIAQTQPTPNVYNSFARFIGGAKTTATAWTPTIDVVKLYGNKIKLANGLKSSVVTINKLYHRDNDFLQDKISNTDATLIINGDDNTPSHYIFSGSPEGVVSAVAKSTGYDYTNNINYVKLTGTSNIGWGIAMQNKSTSSGAGDVDLRKFDTFNDTITASAFAIDMDGYADDQVVVFDMFCPSGGAASLPSPLFTINTGTIDAGSTITGDGGYTNTTKTHISVKATKTSGGAKLNVYVNSVSDWP